MNEERTMEQRLTQLGDDLAGPPDFAQRVMAEVAKREIEQTTASNKNIVRRSRWQPTLAIAVSVMLAVGVWWLSRPGDLYARMVAALADAKTVHATGWTRVIVRKWPLETTPAKDLSAQWPDGKIPVEMWHWTDADGTAHSFEKAGPVTLVRHGGDMTEYQEDADLTYVYEVGYNKDRVAEFGGRAQYLSLLERPSLKKENLGTREEASRQLRGLRLVEGDRIEEIWFDEAENLPVRLVRQDKNSGQTMLELTFRVNEQVPNTVAGFTPPPTKHVRNSGGGKSNDAWLAHVAAIGERLQAQPLAGRIALWPRADGRMFSNQWPLLTSNGKYWVRPLNIDQYAQMSLNAFIRLGVATEDGDQRHGTWRIPKELHELQFPRADLIHVADMPWQEWVQFALGQLGLELVDQTETQKVWIAKHDGRPLKPWQQTKPPVAYVVEGGKEKKGYVRPGIGHRLQPVTLQELFADFNGMIDRNDLAADKPRIIDETNLPAPPVYEKAKHGTPQQHRDNVVAKFYVATDSPWFVGKESLAMSREWYAKEFGISFTEATRPVTVHVVRRKQ